MNCKIMLCWFFASIFCAGVQCGPVAGAEKENPNGIDSYYPHPPPMYGPPGGYGSPFAFNPYFGGGHPFFGYGSMGSPFGPPPGKFFGPPPGIPFGPPPGIPFGPPPGKIPPGKTFGPPPGKIPPGKVFGPPPGIFGPFGKFPFWGGNNGGGYGGYYGEQEE